MAEFAEDHLTRDGFLGGRLTVLQPRAGYRAGVDPVLLAAAVPARPGQTVLELGCGAGVASLCLAARLDGLTLTGVEMQRRYAALARRNADLNGVAMTVVQADLCRLPADQRGQNFDHVIANPPYYHKGARTPAADAGREAALGEETPLADWLDTATRRLKPKGYLTVIQDAARLPDLLGVVDDRLGDLVLQPLAARAGGAAHLIILQARKGARGPMRLNAPVVMHEGDAHDGDRESYLPAIRAVLRDGAALAPLAG